MSKHLIANLTPAQREAVQFIDGPLLILAGPGSGKTRVVTHRIANLLSAGIPARSILALTFTNKAAEEMRSRVERLAPGQAVWTSTFHRFCARLLRQYGSAVGLAENFTIYDTSDSARALKHTLHALEQNPEHFTPERIAAAISWAKNNLITAEQFEPRPGHPLGKIVAEVYPAYQQRLLTSGAADFDDLLLHVATLLRENPEVRRELDERYRYILVDEYQDTNLAQYTIARALSIDYPNLAVTGDPDQSIYGWRGANLSNILEFERDFPNVRVVRLEQNYRSTKRILRVAAELIAHNKRRKEKALFTDNDEGAPVRFTHYANQKDEAEHIVSHIASEVRAGRRRPRDFAIFYRVNALSRSFETALREQGVPFQMVNSLEFYQRKEIKDVLSYLQLLNNPRDSVAFLRVINTPPRGIGKTTITRLTEHATRYGISLFEAARESGLIEDLPKRAAVAVARFVAMYDRLQLFAMRRIEEIMGHVLAESGYHEHLRSSEAAEDQERLANIEELLTAAREFDVSNPGEGHLEQFLEEACLVNDTDGWDVDDDRVTLMTLHASKGLEFPVVFITALEQRLIPHERSLEKPDQLEEERRLLFVGVTRAQQELRLSQAQYREFRGQRRMSVPSQFLLELPLDEIESEQSQWDVGDEFDAMSHEGDWHEPVWEPPDTPSAPVAPAPSGEAPSPAPLSSLAVKLTTAAELGSKPGEPAPVPPEAFQQGMVVRHPEYGLGTIVALGGSGANRRATVEFASLGGQKAFVLAKSPLRPLRNG